MEGTMILLENDTIWSWHNEDEVSFKLTEEELENLKSKDVNWFLNRENNLKNRTIIHYIEG